MSLAILLSTSCQMLPVTSPKLGFKDLLVSVLNAPISTCMFSSLFFIHFLWCWLGELAQWTKHFIFADHFLSLFSWPVQLWSHNIVYWTSIIAVWRLNYYISDNYCEKKLGACLRDSILVDISKNQHFQIPSGISGRELATLWRCHCKFQFIYFILFIYHTGSYVLL